MEEMLEMAEAHMALRQARQHRAGLRRLAPHAFACRHDGERAGGGNSKRGQRLAAKIFADGGAHHRAAIAEARIRRLAGALELDVPQLALGVAHLPDQQGAAIAQLPGPDAELMAGIDHRQGRKTVQRAMTGHHLDKARIVEHRRIQVQQRGGGGIGVDQARRRADLFGRHPGVEIFRQLGVVIFEIEAEIRYRFIIAPAACFARFSATMQFSSSPRKRERSCLPKPA